MNWNALAPLLKNNGYCVFALNYGAYWPGPFLALDDVPGSAAELSAYVDSVLSATGAREVDVVGHSQGGMMPRWYVKYLGGAAKVHTLVGLTPSNHGTTLLGLSTIAGYIPGASAVLAAGGPALQDQRQGSAFNRTLDAGGDTIAGVSYTVIASRYDEVVTPYTNSFLSGATNITLQSGCFVNFTEHLGIAYDRRALRLTLNALDPATARTPPCVPTLPGVVVSAALSRRRRAARARRPRPSPTGAAAAARTRIARVAGRAVERVEVDARARRCASSSAHCSVA